MAEFYQVKTIPGKDGQEVLDLQQLNFILRRIFDLLEKTGAPTLTGNMDLSGNRALNGVANQSAAQQAELITRAYLKSAEAAKDIYTALQSIGAIKSLSNP